MQEEYQLNDEDGKCDVEVCVISQVVDPGVNVMMMEANCIQQVRLCEARPANRPKG